MEIFQKKSKLFGVASMYVYCDNPGFIAGPKYVCEYVTTRNTAASKRIFSTRMTREAAKDVRKLK
jgi:hypothetical protein